MRHSRHTLATEILVSGGTIEDAANILGDTPEIIHKHYAKWSAAYRTRTLELFRRVHGTPLSHEKNETIKQAESIDWMVLEERVELSCPVKGAGF